jgi:hypothetical protein
MVMALATVRQFTGVTDTLPITPLSDTMSMPSLTVFGVTGKAPTKVSASLF